VKGKAITGTRDLRGRILIISLDECTVTYKGEILFQPEWGIYDMAIGKEVISAYAGAADVDSFKDNSRVSEVKTHKINYTESEKELYSLYDQVKKMRETDSVSEEKITEIFNQLKTNFSQDWLLNIEIYELALQNNYKLKSLILERLEELKCNKSYTKLIENGLVLCKN
jgi:phenylalanine-4-hydroxylase